MTDTGPTASVLNQASILEREGRKGDALQLLRGATRAVTSAAACRAIAQAALRLGDATLAIEQMQLACERAPGDASMQFQFACLLAHQNRHAQAILHFQQVLARQPEHAQAWHLLGLARQQLGRHSDALAALRRALALTPGNTRVVEALAESEFHAGYPEDALPLWQGLLRDRPGDVNAVLRTAETLNRLGRHEEAIAVLRQALAHNPQAGDLWLALAQTEEDAGDRDAARKAYRSALELRPDWAFPVSGLLGLDRGNAGDELVDQARRLLAQPALPDPDRALIGYELGKVLDGRGEYEAAMGTWHQANAARRRMTGSDTVSLSDAARRLVGTLDRGRLRARTSRWPGNPDERPLFVVGMPRSGTTLTEQILAAHPAGHGCGELPDIALIARNLPASVPGGGTWPDCIDDIPDAALDEAAGRYLRAATRHAPPGALRLVDKAPLNFFHLGLISLLFPRARVVWCRRDPRDIAISVYGENFALEERLATRLEDIGHYINLQTRLMRHWQSVLALPILELCYEALASRPEPQARRLVDFAGLPWDPACLEFHRSDRGVQTPSRWQVKQPIYTRSIGRWRNYEGHLAPLLAVLDAAAYPVTDAMDGPASSAQASTPSA